MTSHAEHVLLGFPQAELDAVTSPYTDDTDGVHRPQDRRGRRWLRAAADLAPVSGSEILPPTSPVSGYTLSPYYSYGIQYYLINFHNPNTGPVFSSCTSARRCRSR